MQATDLSSNFFALFDLPVSFDIDLNALAECYRQAQRAVHPDKFANSSEAERRFSVQMAARVNEGYRILKDPLARARHMLEVLGVELDDMDTAFDGAFLMEQMELRERLADVKGSADPHQQLQTIAQNINAFGKTLTGQLAELLLAADVESLQQARVITRKLQFFRRLNEEVDALDDELSEF
ncbi:MAG: Fe-S protein assembly co-chaperone HscB [Ectothiorhodospiraceae bacterium]|nr:Fe-S protein assembly co-chaperone HscB [Ectothiorhodospiraceae bacterium]